METPQIKKSAALATELAASPDALTTATIAQKAIAAVAAQEEELDQAEKLNLELQEKLDRAVKGEVFKHTIEVDGKTYAAEHAVNFKGKVYKPADIVEQLDIATELVALNSSALVLQPAKATE